MKTMSLNTPHVIERMLGLSGIDTSSHLTSFILFNLAKNPDVQDKLYEEVQRQLPTKESKLDKNALDKMPYLRAVVKESLRVTPPVALMARKLEHPLELGGFKCPENVVYCPAHWHMSNNDR